MFFEMQSFLLGPLKSSTLPFKVLHNTVHAAAPPLITGKEPMESSTSMTRTTV